MHCLHNVDIIQGAGSINNHTFTKPCHSSLLQLELCLPEQMTCVRNFKKTNFDCPNACSGLFADMQIDQTEEKKASSDVKAIVEEYIRYKESYAQNIEFNSSSPSTYFGEMI